MDLCFWFSTLSSLSLNHFPPNHPSFPPLINNSPHTPHEDAVNAVNDNTLALFLFTTPHHHFTRPSLPSHSPHHSSSLLTHCVQPLPMVSPTMPCKHICSCNTPLPLSPHSTLSSNTSLLPSSLWCTGQTHATLCTTSGFGKRGVVHAMCCHSTLFTLVHSFALLTHSVCHWLSLSVKHIH